MELQNNEVIGTENISETPVELQKKRIVIQDVINYLHSGATRKKSSKNYSPTLRSIEEIYGLKPSQVDRIFKHEKLKGIKTKYQIEDDFELIDADELVEEDTTQDDVEIESEVDFGNL